MRLKTYIHETSTPETIEEIANLIRENCKLFLKEVGRDNYFYRGINDKFSFAEKTPRQDRIPMDTPPDWHRWIDNYFNKKFGWKPRSQGIFTTPMIFTADFYGQPYFFFPIGDYKYVWSPKIEDFFKDIADKYPFEKFKSDKKSIERENILKAIEAYTDKNIRKNKSNEIIFLCKTYYLLNTTHYNRKELTNLLWR